MTGPGIVEQYWTGVASQLQVEADVFSRLVGHNGETGRSNELALARLVESLVPSRIGVGTGIVIDSAGNRSSQIDLILFDRGAQPQMLAQATQLLFPVETVLGVVEVKTTVTDKEILDGGVKFESVRVLQSNQAHPPLCVFFGYRSANAVAERAKTLNAQPPARRADVACVLDPGMVSDASPGGLNAGLVPLHATDEHGSRLSREWIAAAKAGPVVRGAHTYPTSSLMRYRDRKVFEPGRALLLFTELLLQGLAQRRPLDTSWFSTYLPPIARETVVPPANVP